MTFLRNCWLIIRESLLHPCCTSVIRSDGTIERGDADGHE